MADRRMTPCSLLILLISIYLWIPVATASEVLDRSLAEKMESSPLDWYDIQHLGLEGQGWSETLSPFDRLPAKAEGIVRKPVWSLSRHSAGICTRFVTDATEIHAIWELTSQKLAMAHMPATGVSGLDLYVKTQNGEWRWLANGRPQSQRNSAPLVTGLPAGEREYLLYLPLYNGVQEVKLGIPHDNTLARTAPRTRKPFVFYGTSITQGGCASRPGMVHTAILGRRLDYPVINLGFSGNGTMDPELADLMSELDAACYIIDCLPNMKAATVRSRVEPLVHKLRGAHPQTPILLVEDRTYSNSFLYPAKQQRHATSRAALQTGYQNLLAAGVQDLHYLEGEHLLGDKGNDTVDGSHPTDLGFIRQADAFEQSLLRILKSDSP